MGDICMFNIYMYTYNGSSYDKITVLGSENNV